jgi:hypothetical protein
MTSSAALKGASGIGPAQFQARAVLQRGAVAAPGAAQAAPAGGLALGHQQHRVGAALAGAAHEFGVGGAQFGQDFYAKAG